MEHDVEIVGRNQRIYNFGDELVLIPKGFSMGLSVSFMHYKYILRSRSKVKVKFKLKEGSKQIEWP